MSRRGCLWAAPSVRQHPAPRAGATPASQSVSLIARVPVPRPAPVANAPSPAPGSSRAGGGEEPDRTGRAPPTEAHQSCRESAGRPRPRPRAHVSRARTGNPSLPTCTLLPTLPAAPTPRTRAGGTGLWPQRPALPGLPDGPGAQAARGWTSVSPTRTPSPASAAEPGRARRRGFGFAGQPALSAPGSHLRAPGPVRSPSARSTARASGRRDLNLSAPPCGGGPALVCGRRRAARWGRAEARWGGQAPRTDAPQRPLAAGGERLKAGGAPRCGDGGCRGAGSAPSCPGPFLTPRQSRRTDAGRAQRRQTGAFHARQDGICRHLNAVCKGNTDLSGQGQRVCFAKRDFIA